MQKQMQTKQSIKLDSSKSKYNSMMKIENKLNIDIGFKWWKLYIASAFWSNISTPINLTITLLTALTTTQTTTGNLLPHNTFVSMSVIVLILTVINTYFRPHNIMVQNMKEMKVWSDFGNEFETIYYTECICEEDYVRRFDAYKMLQNNIKKYNGENDIEKNSFVTDLIHIVARYTFLKNNEKWLELYDDDDEEEESNGETVVVKFDNKANESQSENAV